MESHKLDVDPQFQLETPAAIPTVQLPHGADPWGVRSIIPFELTSKEKVKCVIPFEQALERLNVLKRDFDQLPVEVLMPLLVTVRKALSVEVNPPIQQVLSHNILEISSLAFQASQRTQALTVEVLWILTNIASGSSSDTQQIVSSGMVPIVMQFIDFSNGPEVVEQAIWLVANVAGDSTMTRDYCIGLGLVPKISELVVNKELSQKIRTQAMWCLSNTCRGKPRPDYSKIAVALPALQKVLESVVNHQEKVPKDAIKEALWAVSYMSDAPNDVLNDIVKCGIMKSTMALLRGYVPPPPAPFSPEKPLERIHDYRQVLKNNVPHDVLRDIFRYIPAALFQEHMLFLCKDWFYDVICLEDDLYTKARNPLAEDQDLQIPALRACGNIVTGDDMQTQYMLDNGFVTYLQSVLNSQNKAMRKEALWSLSNIAAGTVKQIQTLIDPPKLLRTVCEKAVPKGDVWEVHKEAVWVVANILAGGTAAQQQELLENGAIVALIRLVAEESDSRVFDCALEGLNAIKLTPPPPALIALKMYYDLACAPIHIDPPTLSSFDELLMEQDASIFLFLAKQGLPWLKRAGCQRKTSEVMRALNRICTFVDLSEDGSSESGEEADDGEEEEEDGEEYEEENDGEEEEEDGEEYEEENDDDTT